MAKKGNGKKSNSKTLKKVVLNSKKENGKINKKDIRTISVFCLIFIILLGLVLFYKFSYNIAKEGDKVEVKYVGSLEDGKVFDTSIKEVAIANGMYNPKRSYSDLKFTLGKGQMIKGFDEAVIGMRLGDEKTVIVPPEKAYGPYFENKTMNVNLSKTISRYGTTTRDIVIRPEELVQVFNISDVKINDTLPATGKYKYPVLVIKISNEDLTGRLQIKPGDYYEEGLYNISITSVRGGDVTFKRTPLFEVLPSKYGGLIAKVEKDRIILTQNATIGNKVALDNATYFISKIENNTIILDQNHPLAGKNLVFKITLDNIE